MRRALFLLSDTGGGHRAVAEAIRTALYRRYGRERIAVELVDVFRSYAPAPFKYAPAVYPWWVNRSKTTWGMSYNLSNTRRRVQVLSRGMYVSLEGGLKRLLEEHPADVVVCLHSLLAHPIMETLSRLEQRPPFMTVVTDLASTHLFWYDKRAERCLLPTWSAYHAARIAGLAPDQLRVTGLPVHPRFHDLPTDRVLARRQLGWDEGLPVVLAVGGGDGMGPLYEIARALDARRMRCQLVVVAGKNADLRAKLAAQQWQQPTIIYPFVQDMASLMAAADILVTKAGPATISEACVAGLPMILSDAIPGQETGNVRYIVENHAGAFAPQPMMVAEVAEAWLAGGTTVLGKRADRVRRLGRPNAVWDVAEEVWRFAHHLPIASNRRGIFDGLIDFSTKFIPSQS